MKSLLSVFFFFSPLLASSSTTPVEVQNGEDLQNTIKEPGTISDPAARKDGEWSRFAASVRLFTSAPTGHFCTGAVLKKVCSNSDYPGIYFFPFFKKKHSDGISLTEPCTDSCRLLPFGGGPDAALPPLLRLNERRLPQGEEDQEGEAILRPGGGREPEEFCPSGGVLKPLHRRC